MNKISGTLSDLALSHCYLEQNQCWKYYSSCNHIQSNFHLSKYSDFFNFINRSAFLKSLSDVYDQGNFYFNIFVENKRNKIFSFLLYKDKAFCPIFISLSTIEYSFCTFKLKFSNKTFQQSKNEPYFFLKYHFISVLLIDFRNLYFNPVKRFIILFSLSSYGCLRLHCIIWIWTFVPI